MNSAQGKRVVTRVWLMAELNAQLKAVEKEHADCGGCRVKRLTPVESSSAANWVAELFGTGCQGTCLDHCAEIIDQMQRHCDVTW